MRKYLMPVSLALLSLLLSCNTSDNQQEATNKALEAAGAVTTGDIDTLCYLATTEAKNKDTLAVSLIIKGDAVSGRLVYFYYQKDGRFGTLTGTKIGDIIKATWYYEQEGMKDSVAVAFKLGDPHRRTGRLQQKTTAFDTKTGHEYLPDDAPYERVYEQVDCDALKKVMRGS